MKKYYWIVLSLFLYVCCAGIGVAVKNSYVDVWAAVRTQPPEEVLYVFRNEKPKYALSLNASAETIVDHSKIIVIARAEQESSYEGKTFLTQMKVEKILKNDGTLNSERFTVCEPIVIDDAKDKESEYISYSIRAGSTPGMGIKGAFNRTKIVPGQSYVLFLESFLPEEWETNPPLYTLIESPYAKLQPDSTVGADNYEIPVQTDSPAQMWKMPFQKSLEYEILLQEPPQIEQFFQTKEELLSLLDISK